MGRLRRRPTGIEAELPDSVLMERQLLSELQSTIPRYEDGNTSYGTRPRPKSSPLPRSSARHRPTLGIPCIPAWAPAPGSFSVASDNLSSDDLDVAGVSSPSEPSSAIGSSRCRTFSCFFISLGERYLMSPRKVLVDACCAVCIVQFAPILLPAAVMMMIHWLLGKIISSTRFALAPGRRALLRLAVEVLLAFGALTLMGEFHGGEPPDWGNVRRQWGDDLLLKFEDRINEGCGRMGRRLLERMSRMIFRLAIWSIHCPHHFTAWHSSILLSVSLRSFGAGTSALFPPPGFAENVVCT